MAKVQRRKGVSMGRATFERLDAYCRRVGVPKASIVERVVEDHLDALATSELVGASERKRALDAEARARDASTRCQTKVSAPMLPGRPREPQRAVGNGHGVGGVHEV